MYFYLAFYQLFSEDLLSSKNINGEGLVAIFDFIDMLQQKKVIESSCSDTCARQRFIHGEVEFLIDGDWAFNELDEAFGRNLYVNPLPTYRG
ncbi:maltose/maltodextrin-binding protein, partial [Vibrio sp. 10N.286.49.E1]